MADEQSKSRGLDGKHEKVSLFHEGEKVMDVTPTKASVGKPKVNALTVKVDVDVSDALTGLKALTREAKAATVVLKEAETTAERLEALLADVTDENRHEAIDYIRRSYE